MLEPKGEESEPIWALALALSWQVTCTVVSGLHHAPPLSISLSKAERCQVITPSCLPLRSLVEP